MCFILILFFGCCMSFGERAHTAFTVFRGRARACVFTASRSNSNYWYSSYFSICYTFGSRHFIRYTTFTAYVCLVHWPKHAIEHASLDTFNKNKASALDFASSRVCKSASHAVYQLSKAPNPIKSIADVACFFSMAIVAS